MAVILPVLSLLLMPLLGKYDEMGNCTIVGTAVEAVAATATVGTTGETPRETADLQVETEVLEDLLVLATSIALQNSTATALAVCSW
jgi:hypothetical protein